MSDPIEAEQVAVCEYYHLAYTPAPLDSKVGFALRHRILCPLMASGILLTGIRRAGIFGEGKISPLIQIFFLLCICSTF